MSGSVDKTGSKNIRTESSGQKEHGGQGSHTDQFHESSYNIIFQTEKYGDRYSQQKKKLIKWIRMAREEADMKKNVKLILEYDGTRYDGWQKQGNTDNTIQGKLESVLSRWAGEAVEIHGSGRTDAGVHAKAQTANFHIDSKSCPTAEAAREYLNRYLPEDIRVLEAEEVSERFHSRLSAVKKTYTYYVETAEKKNVFERRYVYGLGMEPDVEAMEQAARYLIGEHDFKSFCSNKRMKKSTVRTLEEIRIRKEGTKLIFVYTGNGFLYNMVRILTGTLLEVGIGERRPEDMIKILEAKNREAAGRTVPPEGLFLTRVEYDMKKITKD